MHEGGNLFNQVDNPYIVPSRFLEIPYIVDQEVEGSNLAATGSHRNELIVKP